MDLEEFLKSEDSRNPHYLLIGSPIGHSISPVMHNLALEHYEIPAKYVAVGVRNSQINPLISHFNHTNFLGANITIPYKETLFTAVDEHGREASEIGAINTIIQNNGKLIGENTDAFGFQFPLTEYFDELEGERAIIFGTGGATKAIVYALQEMGLEEIMMVSRRPGQYETENSNIQMCSYDNWTAFAEEAAIIVNATPLGMIPNTEASPVQDNEIRFLAGKICYDVVYNPQRTKFLAQTEIVGGTPIGGLEMLIHQGAKSFNLWTGKEFPVGLIKMRLDEIFPNQSY